MTPDKAANERGKLQSQVRFHCAMNAGLLGILFFGVLLLGFVVVRDTARIVPPEAKQPYRVGSNYADKDYLLDIAGCVLGIVLTVTPEMVSYSNKVIPKMADPDGYAGLKTALDAAAIRLERGRITIIWVPRKEEVSEQDERVKVSGRLRTFIADELVSEREEDYLVEFTVTTSGRLYVSKIKEVVKHDPSVSKSTGS